MIEFLVGLFVIAMIGVLSLIVALLLPFLLLMGFFLRFFVGLFFCILVVWLVGKVTLLLIDYLKNRRE